MLDEAQKARPHRIDQRDVEVKRAMPREVIFVFCLVVFCLVYFCIAHVANVIDQLNC